MLQSTEMPEFQIFLYKEHVVCYFVLNFIFLKILKKIAYYNKHVLQA